MLTFPRRRAFATIVEPPTAVRALPTLGARGREVSAIELGRWPTIVLFFTLAAPAGCNGGPPASPLDAGSPPDGSPRSDAGSPPAIAREIGAEGGRLADGTLEIVVPAGALSEPVMLSMRRRSPTPAGTRVAYDIEPDGLEFAEPITLSFAVESTEGLAVARLEADGRWYPLPSPAPVAGRIEGLTTHLSTYAAWEIDPDYPWRPHGGCAPELDVWTYTCSDEGWLDWCVDHLDVPVRWSCLRCPSGYQAVGLIEPVHNCHNCETGEFEPMLKCAKLCGNSRLDDGEPCDGSLLRARTCEEIGYRRGNLSCTDECEYDLSQCEELPTCESDADCENDEQCAYSPRESAAVCVQLPVPPCETDQPLGCTMPNECRADDPADDDVFLLDLCATPWCRCRVVNTRDGRWCQGWVSAGESESECRALTASFRF